MQHLPTRHRFISYFSPAILMLFTLISFLIFPSLWVGFTCISPTSKKRAISIYTAALQSGEKGASAHIKTTRVGTHRHTKQLASYYTRENDGWKKKSSSSKQSNFAKGIWHAFTRCIKRRIFFYSWIRCATDDSSFFFFCLHIFVNEGIDHSQIENKNIMVEGEKLSIISDMTHRLAESNNIRPFRQKIMTIKHFFLFSLFPFSCSLPTDNLPLRRHPTR